MRTLKATFAVAILLILAACGSNNSNTFPEAVVTSVNPAEVTPGAEVTVTGRNYYAVTGAGATRIEACGVTIDGSLVEPLTRTILLPPGSTITAEVGSTITGTLSEPGFTAGLSDVRVARPDGSTAVLENAVTCVIPSEEPEPEPTPVTAAFTASATTAIAPATITFDAAGSTGEGELAYAWDFGVENATTSGAEVTFEYQQAGTYMVALTVTDETGAEAEAAQEVVIHPALQAVIEHSEITSYAPVAVAFDATNSTGIVPLTYAWDFGDETGTSTEPEPTYEYGEPGTYTVTLTVTDTDGETDSTTAELVIPAVTPVNAVITADTVIGTAPLTVNFSALNSTGEGELEYAWDFLFNSGTSEAAEPQYTFAAGGSYTVSLTVTDAAGATDTSTQVIAVDAAPGNISFAIEPANLEVDIDVLVEGDNVLRLIRLPDGTTNLPPGEYNLIPQVQSWTDTFNGQDVHSTWTGASKTITVAEDEVRVVTLSFTPRAGVIDFTQVGLPELWDYSDHVSIEALHTPLDLPAPTTNLGRLVPGLYELTSTIVRAQTGNLNNDTAFITEYEPLEATVQLAVSSGVTTEHEFTYRIIPVSSLTLGDFPELPAGVEPVVNLLDADLNRLPEDWTDLTPGHYRLEYGPVHHVNPDSITRHDDTTVDAYERYTTSNSLHSVYLSSGEDAVHAATYALQDAMLDVEVKAPEGTNTAHLIVTDPGGTEHHYTEATNGRIQLYVPIGEYHVEFRDPPGYRSLISGRSPAGYNLVDESYFYDNTISTFLVDVEYEAVNLVPVTINVTPADLQVEDLEVLYEDGSVAGTVSGTGTLDPVNLTPGLYSIDHHDQEITRTTELTIDGDLHQFVTTYEIPTRIWFDVYRDTPLTVPVAYSPVSGSVEFIPQNEPEDSTITYDLKYWNGTSWLPIANPDLDNLTPGVYEVTGQAVTDSGFTLTTNAVRFPIDSGMKTNVLPTFPALPAVNFNLPLYPDLGPVDIVVYTSDSTHINSWNDQGDSPPVVIPEPGNYYAAVTADPVTISEEGYAYDTFYNSPYHFTINPTDSGVITIDIPELQPVNAEVVITSNLSAEHGAAISRIEHLNDTGSWEQIAGETLPGTLTLPPGVYRVTTRTVTIERGYWTEVLTTADEHVIVGLNSGVNGGIYFEYAVQPSLGVSVSSNYPDAQHTFTLTNAANTHQYDHNDTQVPPGRYTIRYDPIDVTNDDGRNEISPTYERLRPSSTVQTIYLSSNEQLTRTLNYNVASSPAIRVTITAPDGTTHPFGGDVWIFRHSNKTYHHTAETHNETLLPLGFDEYCIEARDTDYFVVTSNSHEEPEDCFTLDTSYDYEGGTYAVDVVIHYSVRGLNGTIHFPDHPTGEARASDAISFRVNINANEDLDRMLYYYQVNDNTRTQLGGVNFGVGRRSYTIDYPIPNQHFNAGDQVKAIVVVETKSGVTATFESPPLQILP